MATIFNRDDAPGHLFAIPELDLSRDLFAERLGGPFFTLGALTIKPLRDERSVEDMVLRRSVLLAPEHFAGIFDMLGPVGNVIGNLGKPGGSVLHDAKQKEYRYAPFHRFEFPFTSAVGEPLVFIRSAASGTQLVVNPDLWLFFELEETTRGSGVWMDPRRGVDALVRRMIDHRNLEVVEIRVDYLRRYLQARQMSLVVGHYCHLRLFDPSQSTIEAFVDGEWKAGSPEEGAKVFVQNSGLGQYTLTTTPFLQRTLHLWFEIIPQAIDIEDPWADQPSFDPYMFTLPTRVGPVAPARWKLLPAAKGRVFDGGGCDFMDRVWFRQEVLTK